MGLHVRWIDPAFTTTALAAMAPSTRCIAAHAGHMLKNKIRSLVTRASRITGWPQNSDLLYTLDKLRVHRGSTRRGARVQTPDRRSRLIQTIVQNAWGAPPMDNMDTFRAGEANIAATEDHTQRVVTARATLTLHLGRQFLSADPFPCALREVLLAGMFASERWVVRAISSMHTRGYTATIYWSVPGTRHIVLQRCLLDLRKRELVFAPVSRQRMSDCPRCLTTEVGNPDKILPESWHNGYLTPVSHKGERFLYCTNCKERFEWPGT